MADATTPVPTQREPDLVGQTVVVIGCSAGIGLEIGSMPCDGPWPEERVGLFRKWLDADCPA
jgi:hypothetical protein